MNLNTYCKECQSKNRIPSRGILTRQDLKRTVGNEIKFECRDCGKTNKVHINRIFATSSKLPVIICSLIGLVFIVGAVAIKHKNGWSIIWGTGIGGLIISAGFASNIYSISRVFNKTLI